MCHGTTASPQLKLRKNQHYPGYSAVPLHKCMTHVRVMAQLLHHSLSYAKISTTLCQLRVDVCKCSSIVVFGRTRSSLGQQLSDRCHA